MVDIHIKFDFPSIQEKLDWLGPRLERPRNKVAALFMAACCVFVGNDPDKQHDVVAYSDLLLLAQAGDVKEIMVGADGQRLYAVKQSGQKFVTVLPAGENVIDRIGATSTLIQAEWPHSYYETFSKNLAEALLLKPLEGMVQFSEFVESHDPNDLNRYEFRYLLMLLSIAIFAKSMISTSIRSIKKCDPKELELTAYHEAGHTIALLYGGSHKTMDDVSIVPKPGVLGRLALRIDDNYYKNQTLDQIKSELVVDMAGMAAEEILKGKGQHDQGATSDIRSATYTARRALMEEGMSETLGPVAYTNIAVMSEAKKQQIENEVEKLLKEALQEARQILLQHKDKLEILAKALLEKHTLNEDEVKKLIGYQDAAVPAPAMPELAV